MTVARPARAAVSRADLALLVALDDRLAEAAAPLLGFEAPLPVVQPARVSVAPASVEVPREPEPPPAKAGSMPFWRLAAVTFAEAEGPAPPPPPAVPLPELDGDVFTGRPLAPIVPWSRLEARLQRHLGAEMQSRRVDAPALGRALASARPIRRIPLKSMKIWPRRLHIWVDWNPRLLPLWPDAVLLANDLLRRCGAEGLLVQVVQPGEVLPVGRVQPGDSVLVVSDFGVLSGGAGRWQLAAHALRRRGIRPRALVPGSGSVEGYETLPWEPSARRADGAAVQRLLDRLSCVELAQPALLRDVRRLDPGVGVMAELRVWNHPAFAAGDAAGLVMRPDERERRRERFADDPARPAVRALVAQHRQGQPADLLARDHLLWPGADGPADESVALRYLSAVEAIQLHGDPGWRAHIEQHAVAGIPATRLNDKQLGPVLQRIVARVHSGRSGVPVPETLDMQAIRDTEPAPADVTYWAVRQVGSRLHFAPATTPTWPSAEAGPGSPVAVLPARRATLFATASGRTQYQLGEAAVPLPAGDLLTLETDLATLTLRRDRPAWAAAVGRDRYGLWADLEVEGVRQRLRWIPRGGSRWAHPRARLVGIAMKDRPTRSCWTADTGWARRPSRRRSGPPHWVKIQVDSRGRTGRWSRSRGMTPSASSRPSPPGAVPLRCPRRPSGSTPAARAPPPRPGSATMKPSAPASPGTTPTRAARRIRWGSCRPTRGGCTTCSAT
ncbi:MAG: hypothetical protein R3F60_18095 [bacterium]